MEVVFAYITFPHLEEAEKIAQVLVEKKLVACVNLLPQMKSIYHWEGKIEKSQEVVMIAKTLKRQTAALLEEIRAEHSYTCPCVVFFEAKGGNEDYLKWISNSVS